MTFYPVSSVLDWVLSITKIEMLVEILPSQTLAKNQGIQRTQEGRTEQKSLVQYHQMLDPYAVIFSVGSQTKFKFLAII